MPRRAALRPFTKYLLLELPGWVLAAGVLGVLVATGSLGTGVAVGLFALWVAKDFALYPVLRIAYEEGSPDGTASLVGALGIARGPIEREGWVAVGSELWRARLRTGAAPLDAGAKVRVLAVRDLELLVEPA